MAVGIIGSGSFVPEIVIGTRTIAEWTGVDAERIERKTGIANRRYADAHTPTSVLALAAVVRLCDQVPDALDDLAAIIVATSTPDQPQPSTAALLHRLLGIAPVAAWDLNAVCAGGLVGLVSGAAHAQMTGGRVLVVAADRYSGILDRHDYPTVSLFGDGAGAVLLGPVPDGYGLRAHAIETDGTGAGLVGVTGGGTLHPLTAESIAAGEDRFRMDGRGVRTWVMERLPRVVRTAAERAGIELDAVSRLVAHQANPVMLDEIGAALGIEPESIEKTAPEWGNSGAASLLATLANAHVARPFARGDQIMLAAVGGGMTAAAAVITWY